MAALNFGPDAMGLVHFASTALIPAEFRSYFEYCRSLRFEDRPDYAYLKVRRAR